MLPVDAPASCSYELDEQLRMRLFERDALPEITHGMCPDCQAEVTALIHDDR